MAKTIEQLQANVDAAVSAEMALRRRWEGGDRAAHSELGPAGMRVESARWALEDAQRAAK